MRLDVKASDYRAALCALALTLVVLCAGSASPAQAATLRQGQAAYLREDYVSAGRIFVPLAKAGNAVAQAYLGFMFEYGRGVPQNYPEAAYWYGRAAEQGHSTAQCMLGLLFDKGFGVPEDIVEAGKWLTLAAASASKDSREYFTRLRDAVKTKMTRGQVFETQRRALAWYPKPETPVRRKR